MVRGEATWNINQLVPIYRNGKLEEVFWTYSYSPVRDKDGAVQGTLVVCSETTDQVLAERRLRALLAIDAAPSAEFQPPVSQPLAAYAQAIVAELDRDPADVPFAGLYLLEEGRHLLSASTPSMGVLAPASHWPLAELVNSQRPVLMDNLRERCGDLVCRPWPEPVNRAYLLPLPMPGLSVAAVLILGISPRLAFEDRYRTFFELVGNRVAALLQSEVHQLDLAPNLP
jgi:hypothetical protein